MSSTNRCIYCTNKKASEEFNTEHVLAKNLAPSIQDNLTLAPKIEPAVCKDCNAYFGMTLDDAIGHDSFEALQRFRFGVKPIKDLRQQPRRRVRVRHDVPTLFGRPQLVCRVVPADEEHDLPLAVEPVPQAVFGLKQGGWLSLPEEELLVSYPRSDPRLDPEGKVFVFGIEATDGADVFDRLITLLEMKGFSMEGGTPVRYLPERGEISTVLEVSIDSTIARSVAKFAFNFLAFQAGPEYVLRHEFDEVREFIRYGTGEWQGFVKVPKPASPLLRRERCPKHCHRISLRKARVQERRILSVTPQMVGYVGVVTLFGEVVYQVRLSRSIPGLWRRLEGGYQYNLQSQTVKRLSGTPDPYYAAN